MKNISFFLILFLSIFSSAQSVEEKAAEEACKCLSTKENITNDIYNECISQSVAGIFTSEKKIEKLNTVEGIKKALDTVSILVDKKCLRTIPFQKEKKIHYKHSKNKQATNHYIVAKDAMLEKNFDIAIEGFGYALKADPDFVLALDDIAVCYRQLKKFDKAITYYKKSLAIFPQGDLALMNLAVIYALKEDYKTSNTYYKKLILYYPDDAEGYYGYGKNLIMLNDLENALIYIIKAHKIYNYEKSDYLSHVEELEGFIHQEMKKQGKEDQFWRILKDNGIEVRKD